MIRELIHSLVREKKKEKINNKRAKTEMAGFALFDSIGKFSALSYRALSEGGAQRHTMGLRDYCAQKTGLYSLSFIVNTHASRCTTINETLRVYYRVTSFRKKRSEIYYSTKGLLRPKTGLVLPKFHSKHSCNILHHHE